MALSIRFFNAKGNSVKSVESTKGDSSVMCTCLLNASSSGNDQTGDPLFVNSGADDYTLKVTVLLLMQELELQDLAIHYLAQLEIGLT